MYIIDALIALISIFKDVMEECRTEEHGAGTIGEHHACYRQRMGDIRCSRFSELFLVSSLCYHVRLFDEVFAFSRDIITFGHELFEYIIRSTFLILPVFFDIGSIISEVVGILCHLSILFSNAKKSIQKQKKSTFSPQKNWKD